MPEAIDHKRNELINKFESAMRAYGEAKACEALAQERFMHAKSDVERAGCNEQVAWRDVEAARMAFVQHIEERAGYWKAKHTAEGLS